MQRVSTEGYHSQFRTINAGVPQGSILGPHLFLLYINDITENVSTNIKLFADDTSLYVIVDKNPVEAAHELTKDLENISGWAHIWDINFNPTKTKSVLFSRKHNNAQPAITFQNNQITNSKTHKHLGLTFTDDASWNQHIQTIYEKAYKRLNILRYIKTKISRRSLIKIYIAFIRPILEYADIVWDNCTLQYSELLESVQLEAARIITGLRSGTSHNKLYLELGWETLSARRLKHKQIMMYKITHGLSPQYLQDISNPFINNHNNNPYSLRHTRIFNPPICRTNNYFDSFFPFMCRTINTMDEDLLNSPSLTMFKKLQNKDKVNDSEVTAIFKNNGERRANIILCQLRNFCSNLNSDLYHDHLKNNPSCACSFEYETAYHYFFNCPLYIEQRNILFTSLNNISDHNHMELNVFFLGCPTCDLNINRQILIYIQTFIGKTRRFNSYMT